MGIKLLISSFCLAFFVFIGNGQPLPRSAVLKTGLPSGSRIETTPAVIKAKTASLDEYIIARDYTLTKTNAEVIITNLAQLKTKLQAEKWSIRLEGSSGVYRFQKDNSNVLAIVESGSSGDVVAMKLASMPSSSSQFIEINKLVASDRINNVEFGRAVAISNNYAVVGQQLEDNDAEGKNPKQDAGAAYIYERGKDGKWKQIQKIVAADRAPGANFGCSVGVSGNTIVVGAIYERFDATGRNESTSEGAAYVFERGSDGVWKQIIKLLSSDRNTGYDYFGTSVGIDGNIIVVGAPGHSRDSTERQEGYVGDAGAVFVFEKKGNNWRRTYKLLASDREHGGATGNSVAISGNSVIAGAWAQDFGMNGENRMEAAGAAYIWERMDDGKWWTKGQKLIASDRTPYDEFGFSVAIDGDNAVVGARRVTLNPKDEDNDAYSGEAYIFSRNENGEWKEVKAIIPEDRKTGCYFGASVGVNGNYAIVGAWRGDGKKPYIGVVYIYWKGPDGKWVQSQKISASDEGTYANFSMAVAIHKGLIISGAPMEWRDVAGKNEFSNAGAAYIFMRSDNKAATKANTTTIKQGFKSSTNKN